MEIVIEHLKSLKPSQNWKLRLQMWQTLEAQGAPYINYCVFKNATESSLAVMNIT